MTCLFHTECVPEAASFPIIPSTPVITVTFSFGRYAPMAGRLPGPCRNQSPSLPAIGPAPSRKRSQTAPLYVMDVCQKSKQ